MLLNRLIFDKEKEEVTWGNVIIYGNWARMTRMHKDNNKSMKDGLIKFFTGD